MTKKPGRRAIIAKPAKAKAPELIGAPGARVETYLIQIQDWEWSFYFGLALMRQQHEPPLGDYRHLKVAGRLLRPKDAPVEFAELTLLADLDLTPEALAKRRLDFEPKGVGGAYFSEGRLGGSIGIPHDAMPCLVTALAARRINFLSMQGIALMHSEILIHSLHFLPDYQLSADPTTRPPSRRRKA